jgi:hypothetical protein
MLAAFTILRPRDFRMVRHKAPEQGPGRGICPDYRRTTGSLCATLLVEATSLTIPPHPSAARSAARCFGKRCVVEGRVPDPARNPPEGCTDPETGVKYWSLVAGVEPATPAERQQILGHLLHCPVCRQLSIHSWFHKNAREIAERLDRDSPPGRGP